MDAAGLPGAEQRNKYVLLRTLGENERYFPESRSYFRSGRYAWDWRDAWSRTRVTSAARYGLARTSKAPMLRTSAQSRSSARYALTMNTGGAGVPRRNSHKSCQWPSDSWSSQITTRALLRFSHAVASATEDVQNLGREWETSNCASAIWSSGAEETARTRFNESSAFAWLWGVRSRSLPTCVVYADSIHSV